MKLTSLFGCIILVLNTNIAFSQTQNSNVNVKFLVEGGVEYGGDEILKVFFTNGGDQTMRAGQGGYVSIGGQFEFSAIKNFMLRTSIGFKYNTTAANNANIRLTRIPITIMPNLLLKNNFRLGLGVSTHQSVNFKGDGFVQDIKFTSSLAPRFEVGYKWISLTYTSMKYKAENGKELSANSFGISFSHAF
ncbi:MAG: hypothetical protein KGZ59_00640 [Chitinophagaceae bacterium]|nr:hypothetical protein [Chitinophagaceae bacterium]